VALRAAAWRGHWLTLEEAVALVGYGMSHGSGRSDLSEVGMTCSSETAVGFGCWSLGDEAAWPFWKWVCELVRRR
jgi:hypothetical protein